MSAEPNPGEHVFLDDVLGGESPYLKGLPYGDESLLNQIVILCARSTYEGPSERFT